MKQLVSLEDFNAAKKKEEADRERTRLERLRNGIACPKCGKELCDAHDSETSINLSMGVTCVPSLGGCGFAGSRLTGIYLA